MTTYSPVIAAAFATAGVPMPADSVAPAPGEFDPPFLGPTKPGSTIAPQQLGLLGRAALGSHGYVGGNKADLLVEYDQWLPSIYADLESATREIDIVEYNWEPTGPGQKVAEILKAKAAAGVEVNVEVDKYGSMGADSEADPKVAAKFFDDLRAAGVHVIVSDPGPGDWHDPLLKHLDHRKLFDIDHRIAHVGGEGLAESPRGKYQTWHDGFLRVEGPAAAQAGQEFLARWVELGGDASQRNTSDLADAMEHPKPRGTAEVRLLANDPGIREDATVDFLHAAATAQRRLWVMTPYIGDQRVNDALVAAKRRGVDVRIIVPGDAVKQNPLFNKISHTFYPQLIDAGIPVYGFPRMLHMKQWLADDTLTEGSMNLSRGSLEHYMELSASVRDARASAQAVANFQHDFDTTAQIDSSDVGGPGMTVLAHVRHALHIGF